MLKGENNNCRVFSIIDDKFGLNVPPGSDIGRSHSTFVSELKPGARPRR